MSTNYLPRTPIPFNEVKGLDIGGIREEETEDTTPDNCCLTDGDNCLWAVKTSFNFTWFSRYGRNFVGGILEVLSGHFDTEFVSEHDDDWKEVLNLQSVEGLDHITIPLPTPENPGPWKQVYP